MKNSIIFSSIIFILILNSGCIQSIHPYYTKNTDFLFEEIYGYWSMVKNSDSENSKEKNYWIFTEDTITIYESDNSTSTLGVKYFKIKDSILVDYSPYDYENFTGKKSSIYLIPGIISAHSLAKIEFQKNRMTIYPFDSRYVINKIKTKKYNLNFYEYGTSMAKSYIFVSESENWVDFLNDNMNDESLFDTDDAFVFERILY